MGLFSFLKAKPKTYQASFSSYKSTRATSYRKPIESFNSLRQESRSKRLFRYFKRAALLSLGLGLGYAIFFTETFSIQKIDITGDAETLTEQNEVNQKLTSYLGRNLLGINTFQIEEELLKNYPYLKNLNVHRGLPQTLRVSLETFPSVANIELQTQDQNPQLFIVNEEGYIARLNETTASLPTLFMDAQAPEEGEWGLNQHLIEGETLRMILKTADDFEGRFSIPVDSITYLKAARELHLSTASGFTVWLDLTQDLNFQLTKLKKALSVLNIYEQNLEYIDLRISGQNGEKVIYKLSSE